MTAISASAQMHTLVVADEAVAEQIHAGRYTVRMIESPEPAQDRIHAAAARVSREVGPDVRLCLTLKSKFVLPNLDRYAALLASLRPEVPFTAVTSVEHGILLRMLGVTQRILLLYVQAPATAALAATYGLEPAVVSRWWLAEARRTTKATVRMHLWVDTGLGREGLLGDDAVALAEALTTEERAGIATHLAAIPYQYPDNRLEKQVRLDPAFTAEQCRRFEAVRARLAARGIDAGLAHAASSGAVQHGLAHTYCDMVRPGRMIAEHFAGAATRPALAVSATVHHAQVAQVKHLPAGWGLGYLGETLSSSTTVALLTTSVGTDLKAGPIAITKDGRRYTLPVALAHGGMCVVRVGDAPVEPGDAVELNPPYGMQREVIVPLGATFDGELYDPLRKRAIPIGSWRRVGLRVRRADRQLVRIAAQSRYLAPVSR